MPSTSVDSFFETFVRPAAPNNWLVAPENFRIRPDVVAPVLPLPAAALLQAFRTVVLGSRGTTLVAESAAALHVVATTPLLRFQDDVWARFIPVAERTSTFAMYSASRVGYWDMGTNRRRLTGWTRRLQDAVAMKPAA